MKLKPYINMNIIMHSLTFIKQHFEFIQYKQNGKEKGGEGIPRAL